MVVSMLFCGALERSNNPYIESIVEPCVSKNQKEIFAMRVLLGRKSWKRAEAMEEYPWAESGICVFNNARERNYLYEITVIILKEFKKCKSLIQKDF